MFQRTLYSGYSIDEFNKIRDALEKEKVPYRYRTHSRLGQWSGRGTVRGSTGNTLVNTKYDLMYEILVRKENLEMARKVLGEVRNRQDGK